MLRQRSIDNNTWSWTDGSLNALNVSVFESTRVGLQACFYRGPIEGVDSADLEGTAIDGGVRVWVATSATTFAQYAWRPGMLQWVHEEDRRDVDGRANPACMGWGAGWTTYVAFVDLDGNIAIYWYVQVLCGRNKA